MLIDPQLEEILTHSPGVTFWDTTNRNDEITFPYSGKVNPSEYQFFGGNWRDRLRSLCPACRPSSGTYMCA